MHSIKIVGLGKYVPEHILKNADLEKIVETSDEWIITRTGIKERRIAKGQTTSDLATQAAKQALKRAGLKAEDIELIIVATITPDTVFPSTACYVQRNLGAKNAAVFDVVAACAGFPYALSVAQGFIGAQIYKNALVIGAETLSHVTNWKDRSTCVLFGDGAGAAVVVSCPQGQGMLGSYLGGNGDMADMLLIPAGGSKIPASPETIQRHLHCIHMQGNELFKIAVRVMVEAAVKVLKKCSLSTRDISLLVPHQANIRIINAVVERLKIPMDKVYVNIQKYGNTSAASTAVALCEAYEDTRMKKGDIVLLDTFGGGLVWGSCIFSWV